MGLIIATILILGVVSIVSFQSVKLLPAKYRVITSTLVLTVLFTPTWAPATIVAFPLPFGMLLGIGVIIGATHEVVELITLFWKWHVVAFPVTLFLAFLVSKKIFRM